MKPKHYIAMARNRTWYSHATSEILVGEFRALIKELKLSEGDTLSEEELNKFEEVFDMERDGRI